MADQVYDLSRDVVIRGLRADPSRKQTYFRDAAGNSLRMRISGATGAKMWVFKARVLGSPRELTLGEWKPGQGGHMTGAKAREIAAQYEEARQQGRDPELIKYDRKTGVTLDDVLDYYETTISGSSLEWFAGIVNGERRPAGGVTGKLRRDYGRTPILDFNALVLKEWIEANLKHAPWSAEKLIRMLSAAFKKAMRATSRLSFPPGYQNPAEGLRTEIKFVEERVPGSYAVAWEPHEWDQLWAGIEKARNSHLSPLGVMLVELLLLTGARPSELQTLRWDEIFPHTVRDGEKTLKMTKIVKDRHKTWLDTKRPRRIILWKNGEAVLKRAKAYQQANSINSEYVFPSTARQNYGKDVPIGDVLRYAREIGQMCEPKMDLKAYNCRSAFINKALDTLGLGEITIVAENVGHASTKTTLGYYHRNQESKQAEAARKVDETFDKYRAPDADETEDDLEAA